MKTISDVAKAANSSISTVSKVFNGYPDVSENTRERILGIARELNYLPNRSAAQLVRGKADTVCLVLSRLGEKATKEEYLLGLLNGVYKEADKNRFRVIMFTPEAIMRNNVNFVQFRQSNSLLGFIIHGLDCGMPEIEHLIASEVPSVFIDANITGNKTAMVASANEQAAYDTVEMLHGLGHRNIVFVSGNESVYVAAERLAGYRRGIQEFGLESQIVTSNFSYEDAYNNVKSHILEKPDTTAIFCASDHMAIGALNACRDLNFRVPNDISIVGFDDMSFAEILRPRLSTVAQDFYEMGITATKVLLDIAQNKPFQAQNIVAHQMMVRDSVAKNTR